MTAIYIIMSSSMHAFDCQFFGSFETQISTMSRLRTKEKKYHLVVDVVVNQIKADDRWPDIIVYEF